MEMESLTTGSVPTATVAVFVFHRGSRKFKLLLIDSFLPVKWAQSPNRAPLLAPFLTFGVHYTTIIM